MLKGLLEEGEALLVVLHLQRCTFLPQGGWWC